MRESLVNDLADPHVRLQQREWHLGGVRPCHSGVARYQSLVRGHNDVPFFIQRHDVQARVVVVIKVSDRRVELELP